MFGLVLSILSWHALPGSVFRQKISKIASWTNFYGNTCPENKATLDVSILLLLTNRYNKGILLHFCQQNGKKIAKLKILTKPSGNGLKNILGQKKFFGA